MSATVDKSTKWSRGMDFLFTCAGGAVGLGNVWRFPYICYKNGGGAFMIPYLIMAFIYGLPMFALETGLGQLTGSDSIHTWKIIPIFKGIGYACLVIMLYLDTSYAVIIAYVVRYTVASFNSVLPWTTCNNTWNTPDCFEQQHNLTENQTQNLILNSSRGNTPVEEYWSNEILNVSSNINEVGVVSWKLLLSLMLVWVTVYLFIWKGFKWTAKAVYVTVPVPFLALFVVLIRGLTLDGAMEGVFYYVNPNITKLGEPLVWINAAEQVCYSYAICLGVAIALSSHNLKHHNFIRDTYAMIFLNMFTSLTAGFAVFSVLGFIAKSQNTTVDAVVDSGPGLAFLVYPKALSLLPFPQIWSVLFFLMLLFLSIDSLFVYQECISQTIFAQLPVRMQKRKWATEITFAIPVIVMGLVSISMITENGYYVFEVFQTGGTGWCYIAVAFVQSIAIGWFFNADKFIGASEILLQRKSITLRWCKICWKYIIPISAPVMVITTWVLTNRLKYPDGSDYPIWAQILGWFMTLSSVVLIPLEMIRAIAKAKGSFKKRVQSLLEPNLGLTVLSKLEINSLERNETYEDNDSNKNNLLEEQQL